LEDWAYVKQLRILSKLGPRTRCFWINSRIFAFMTFIMEG